MPCSGCPLPQHLEVKYEEEKRKCLNELEALRKRAVDREAAVQKAATKQVDALSMQVGCAKAAQGALAPACP